MIRLNPNYDKLQSDYLFVEIARRVNKHLAGNSKRKLIKLGIGDVTKPLSATVIKAFHQGVDEQASKTTFKGYGPDQGYLFLRAAIAQADYHERGCDCIDASDIFISDGAKCDTSNFQELFASDIKVALPDPVYPVYADTNVMAGRTGFAQNGRYQGLIYLEGNESNGFVPSPGELVNNPAELVYLCFPNNPTGATANREQLGDWIQWALSQGAIILYDSAYEAFITDTNTPRSVYEIPGADKCAVEFRSFSKTAGFTGVRCAYTVVPGAIEINGIKLQNMWNRRHSTKFNGVSYPVQKAALAVYSAEGRREIKANIDSYLANARIILDAMNSLGYQYWGGVNSPYVWIKTNEDSWSTFDKILKGADVVITPGSGFGKMGQGYIRISAFNSAENVREALERIVDLLS
ncbi:L,L-diaminopimelate aminotransferase [Olavius algarvensis spirochete endosymbiont]|uniref:LL-diaminopimelate aminotransferase n=1 Tax=Olavius algarvensis spirochete endosymbiont TaxID=260710 RepID=UPI000F2CDD09|nr:LL-diaminopimelate aminotransferase [Olavius algarvensis spirochete endosymbiont]CAD7837249.1 MAG: L,L-diaminopimelate aminotransferase (EC 2.6.1.83) [Olavius algarvensis spirochete endosymbiont]VDB00739.1 L,L-diaminopimelate aminotransferase [Olavius algarvensis spirochete endosymbiont]